MTEGEKIALIVGGGIGLLIILWLLLKPKPQNNDISAEQLGGLIVLLAEL